MANAFKVVEIDGVPYTVFLIQKLCGIGERAAQIRLKKYIKNEYTKDELLCPRSFMSRRKKTKCGYSKKAEGVDKKIREEHLRVQAILSEFAELTKNDDRIYEREKRMHALACRRRV